MWKINHMQNRVAGNLEITFAGIVVTLKAKFIIQT
jgi:hypothetical protein